MAKLHAVALLLCLSCTSIESEHLQFSEGVRRIGFRASSISENVETEGGEDFELRDFDLRASLGFFKTSNIEVGANVALNRTELEYEGAGSADSHSHALGFHVRGYASAVGPSRGFAQVELGVTDAAGSDFDVSGHFLAVGVGVANFISDAAALEVGLTLYSVEESWDPDGGDDFDVDRNGAAILAGISVYF